MSLSFELMLQLAIVIPALTTIAIYLTGKFPNLRESVTVASSLVLIFLAVSLYQAILAGETVNVFWWELLPGLSISFSIEPLGMLFALIASFLWLVTTCYAIGYMRSHHEKNQTRFYACFAIAICACLSFMKY